MAKARIGGRVVNVNLLQRRTNRQGQTQVWNGLAWQTLQGTPTPFVSNQQQNAQTNKMSTGGDDTATKWATNTDASMRILRAQMGQTGNEAGYAKQQFRDNRSLVKNDSTWSYVDSARSYLINNGLNNNFGSVTDGYMTGNSWNQYRNGYGIERAKSAVRAIDAGMKPLPKDMRLVRYEDSHAIQNFLGKDSKLTMRDLRGMSKSELESAFIGRGRETKQYLSASWRMDTSSSRDAAYDSKEFAIEYTVKKGTHAIITNNVKEHEALIGRGYGQRVTGVRRTSKGQVILSVEISPNDRKSYYKI